MILQFLLFLSLGAVFYAYFGYPAVLWVLAQMAAKPVRKKDFTPGLSLVISVYNEEGILPQKIENALSLKYPENLLEIAVISDGSTDRTNEIIQEYAEKDARIRPCLASVNKGKSACLDDFVPRLRGDIILFSDANAFYPEDLLLRIVKPFSDDRIGFVTGSTQYYSLSNQKTVEATGSYTKLEKWTKKLESMIYSCVGADGAVFAIRRSLFPRLAAHDLNDLVIPLHIIRQGYRGVLEEDAICREEGSPDPAVEFRRQARITNRTLYALFGYRDLLNPFKRPLFAFMIFSHKVMKLFTPFFMIILFLVNLMLAFSSSLYGILFILQLSFYALVLRGKSVGNVGHGRWSSLAYTFGMTCAAMLMGWVTFIMGETYATWSPERTQAEDKRSTI
jgi:cellulose synthase/poly-beta-1,6-N-acetylglucosamine synthase-like glycosyltransferase